MKLALFEDRFSGIAGAQENLLILGEGLIAQGHEVKLFTNADGALAQAAHERGVRAAIVPADERTRHLQRSMARPSEALSTARSVARFSRDLGLALKAFNPDVVLASAVRSALYVGLSRPIHRAPLYLFAQNSVPLGVLGLPSAVLASKILLISQPCERSFPSWSRRLLAKKSSVLHSGRDPQHWRRDSHGVRAGDGPVHLLTLCSIVKRKGVHDHLEAVHTLVAEGCDLELTIGGADRGPREYCAAVRQRVVTDDLPVTFVDWLDDPRPLLEAADIFVLASYDEGLPGVLLEAMAYELPCVSTNAGGSADAVAHETSGLVVPVGSPDDLADAIRRLIRSQDERHQFGRSGRGIFEQRFTVKDFVEGFLDHVPSELVSVST